LREAIGLEEGRLKIMGLCGILVPIVAFSCIGVAIALSPWFTWRKNALSDLGAFSSSVWPIFNTGLIVSGALAMAFSYGLFMRLEERLGKAGALITFLGSLSLALIGAFPEDFGFVHLAVSAGFFFLVPIGMLVIGASRLMSVGGALKTLWALLLVLSAASLATWAFWAILRPGLGISVPEAIAAALIATPVVVVGSRIARSAPI